MSSKRFKIGDQVYEFATAADVTLRDLLVVEGETTELGRPLHMGEVTRLGELFESLTEAEGRAHPEGGWMLAVTIWMAMIKKHRDAGDFATRVPFADAIDFSLGDFHPIADPQDRQAGSGKARKKAATRKASPPDDGVAVVSDSPPD